MQNTIDQTTDPATITAFNETTSLARDTDNQKPVISNPAKAGQALQQVTISKLSIIIPAYNEKKTIALIIDRINEVKKISNIEKEFIIVNNCSTEKTDEVAQAYMASNTELCINYFKYLRHDFNQGNSAAIHLDIAQTTGDYLLVQDADVGYNPGEYNV